MGEKRKETPTEEFRARAPLLLISLSEETTPPPLRERDRPTRRGGGGEALRIKTGINE
jgi:hypothetical protein